MTIQSHPIYATCLSIFYTGSPDGSPLQLIKKVIENKLYYLMDYIIFYCFFLAKNEPASKNVGMELKPTISSQSLGSMDTVWKIG